MNLAEWQALIAKTDYQFEMAVHELLAPLTGCNPRHGEVYLDPITGLLREFDFRMTFPATGLARDIDTLVAIECKNSKHDVYGVGIKEIETVTLTRYVGRFRAASSVEREPDTKYYLGQFVARRLGSVMEEPEKQAKKQQNGVPPKLVKRFGEEGDDSKRPYTGWAQSLSSAREFIDAHVVGQMRKGTPWAFTVMPIVVIPNGKLWRINLNGSRMEKLPEAVDELLYAVNYRFQLGSALVLANEVSVGWSIPFVHFMTLSGLRAFLERKGSPLV